MAHPHLPFAARGFDRNATRVDAAFLNVGPAEATGAEFHGNISHHVDILCRSSRASRLEMSQRLL